MELAYNCFAQRRIQRKMHARKTGVTSALDVISGSRKLVWRVSVALLIACSSFSLNENLLFLKAGCSEHGRRPEK